MDSFPTKERESLIATHPSKGRTILICSMIALKALKDVGISKIAQKTSPLDINKASPLICHKLQESPELAQEGEEVDPPNI
jgi:hypothetical protein